MSFSNLKSIELKRQLSLFIEGVGVMVIFRGINDISLIIFDRSPSGEAAVCPRAAIE